MWDTFNGPDGERIEWGEPGDELVERARLMGDIMMKGLGEGFGLNDLHEILWHDKLWQIENEEEFFERVKETVCEMIDETGYGTQKDRRFFINRISKFFIVIDKDKKKFRIYNDDRTKIYDY